MTTVASQKQALPHLHATSDSKDEATRIEWIRDEVFGSGTATGNLSKIGGRNHLSGVVLFSLFAIQDAD